MPLPIAAALLIGAGISAGSSLLSGYLNSQENAKAAEEAKKIDREKLAWQKDVDRFNAVEERRKNDHAITQDSLNQLNTALQTNVALKNRMVSLWGRGRMQ